MTILPLHENSIEQAVTLLHAGSVVALPTETVYGLAGDATNGDAVASIFAVKGRPQFNPLIAHVSDMAMASTIVDIDPLSQELMTAFWPGPLTLVLPLKPAHPIHPLTTAGLSTLAIRQPQGVFAEIVRRLGRPLAAPSANRSGRLSPTSAEAVFESLGASVPLIVDGGAAIVGVESTIIKVVDDKVFLLRPGGLAAETIEEYIGFSLTRMDQRAAIEAPGMLKSHYAPDAPVRLNVGELISGEALLGFGPHRITHADQAVAFLNLSETGDLKEAAAHLFHYLKQLDLPSVTRIAVEPIPFKGLGEAINDRLQRAAAPRG